jgi:hypothetical protein
LLELVLRFIPLRDKLMQLTHLSSACPLLTAGCFSEDRLRGSMETVKALTDSASLQSLLSRVRHLSASALQWQLISCSLIEFNRLQSVDIELHHSPRLEGDCGKDVRDVLMSLSSLPLLHSLTLEVPPFGQRHGGGRGRIHTLARPDIALLSGLRSLQLLTLRHISLAEGALYTLCALPLQQLDLRLVSGVDDGNVYVEDDDDDAQLRRPALAAPQMFDVSCSLRRLHLPAPHALQAEVRQVLAAFGNDAALRRQPVQLEHVEIGYTYRDQELQQLLLRIPSLTELRLVVTQGSSLLSQPASVGLMLPQLRCVTLQLTSAAAHDAGTAPLGALDLHARRRRDWLSEAAAECDGFLRCYAGQLLRLEVTHMPLLPAAAPIQQAAFHCQQLRYLRVHADGRHESSFAGLSFIPLPQLHTLRLEDVRLSRDQLSSLLRACQAVENIFLSRIYDFALVLLPVIGRHCRQLRQLEAYECVVELFSGQPQARLTAGERAGGIATCVFPQLVALMITRFLIPKVGRPSSQTVWWLLRLLQSAPALRFLNLDMELTDSVLAEFSILTSFRGFRLHGSWQSWQQRFFLHNSNGPSHPMSLPDTAGWQPIHEADRELGLARVFRYARALFRDDTEAFDGQTGREAFFAAVNARLTDEERKVEQDRRETCRCQEESMDNGSAKDDVKQIMPARYEF